MSATDGELRASVSLLTKYWDDFHALSRGEALNYYIPSHRLPRWEEICSELPWHTYLIDGTYFPKKHFGYRGVYRLVGLATEGDKSRAATLERVCGPDTTGTLYIGHAKNLSVRLNKLKRTATRRERSHGAIDMLGRTPCTKNFPRRNLQ